MLGFLADGPLSGYELAKAAEAFIGDFWHVTRSQVYRELAQLAARGLVEPGAVMQRSRVPYRLTEAGRSAFEAWIVQPPPVEQIRYPLLLTIAFGSWLGPERLLEAAAAHRPEHVKRLERYRAYRDDAGLDGYQQATVAFGAAYEQAVLSWLDQLPEILSGADVRPSAGLPSVRICATTTSGDRPRDTSPPESTNRPLPGGQSRGQERFLSGD
jgi:DNA-binding PadR family transcriptional regulator